MQFHQIDAVIDVGANLGQYADELREWGFEGKILSIEPTSTAYPTLKEKTQADSKWECFNFAADTEDGVAEMTVASNTGASSSLLTMTESHKICEPSITSTGKEQVQVRRLDKAIATSISPADRLMLKLDTQGAEDRVLRGATGILDQVHLIESELSLVELYEGQKLLPEMLDLFDSLGFQLVFVFPGFSYKGTGHALQVDGTFARKETIPLATRR